MATKAFSTLSPLLVGVQVVRRNDIFTVMMSKILLIFNLFFFLLKLVAYPVQLQPVTPDLKSVRAADTLELCFRFQTVKI